MALDVFYGNAVNGSARFARPELEAEMIRLLEHGVGIKMFGLRRIGKSTFRLFAEEFMAARGYGLATVNAEGMRSIDQLLFGVFAALPRQEQGLRGKFTQWIAGNAALPHGLRVVLDVILKGGQPEQAHTSGITQYWPTISTQIVRLLREDQPKLLVTIDEFALMVKNLLTDQKERGPHQVDMLLASLREWRAAGLKMILTGSIGLAGLARKHEFSKDHINDLLNFQVPPLSDAEARRFIAEATAATLPSAWTPMHTEALLSEAGVLYPCFLVKALLAMDCSRPPPPDAFPELFAIHVRPELHGSFLDQFNRRFRDYRELDREQLRKLILPILRQIMASGTPGRAQSDIAIPEPFDAIDADDALTLLQEDGFLHYREPRDTGRIWYPASGLVDLWWKQARL